MGLFWKDRPSKKLDAVVTGVLLGGVIATVYGLKKRRDKRTAEAPLEGATETPEKKNWWRKLLSLILR